MKCLIWSTLVCVLVFALAVASLPWWGPTAFQRWVPVVLKNHGFSEVEVALERLGWGEAEVRVARLRYQGVAVSDSEIVVQYDLRYLWHGEVEQVAINHPEIEIDLSEDLLSRGEPKPQDEQNLWEKPLPIKVVEVNRAVVTFRNKDWSRSLEFDAQLSAGDKLKGNVRLQGEGVQIDAKAEVSWPDLSGRATGSVTIEELEPWLNVARERGWLKSPEGDDVGASKLDVKMSAGFDRRALADWETTWLAKEIDGSMLGARLSAPTMEISLRGKGMRPSHLEVEIKDGSAGYEALTLDFDRFKAASNGPDWMDADVSADVPRRLTLSADFLDSDLTASGMRLQTEHLKASIEGALPEALAATVKLSGGRLSWSEGAGVLKGLKGEVQLATLQPLTTKGSQELRFVSIEQGDFTTESGSMRFSYEGGPKVENPLELEFSADALGGKVRTVAKGRVDAPRSLALRMYMEKVDLAKVAALFPQFDGRIEGTASGEMALRLEDQRLVLQPGSLRLAPHTVGRFAYTQQGWLTQDSDLDPEAFVKDRDIVDIMKDSKGASVITELALRDLAMSEFTLKVLERDSGDERVMAQIKGHSMVKGVKVPVVLDVPIRGDVKETVNAVLKLNAQR